MNTNSYKFIHTSDWHLGAPVDWKPAEVKEGRWVNLFRHCRKRAIENIVEEAIKNKVVAVLVAGDVIDIYGYQDIKDDISNFLQSKVIIPLRDHGIKLFFTTGTHDENSIGATKLLLKLKKKFTKDIEVLFPNEFKSQFNNTLVKNSTECGPLIISYDPPTIRCRWIEFRHKSNNLSKENLPLYRAFGDKHIMTFKNNRTFFPGTPFARSSASDNQFTDVGPRYCLLYEVDKYEPDPIKLNVPEVAVLKKVLSERKWNLIYRRDHFRDKWIEEQPYEEPIEDILSRIMHELPDVSFVTFVVDKNEEVIYSDTVLRGVHRFVNDTKRAIRGSREGIITVMLKNFW